MQHNFRHINVHPIAGALGAKLSGVDLSKPLGAEVESEIQQAFLDHLVIFFRDQDIAPQQELKFAQMFGEPIEYPQLKGLPDFPLITEVVKLEDEKVNFGGVWHSDTAYLENPPFASMLYALEVPRYGGDTLFANQYMAYETLSEGMKATLEGLIGVNSSTKPDMANTRIERLRQTGQETRSFSAAHPVVRTHSKTGRKALYLNCAHTTHFKGWSEQESLPLLEYLFQHQIKPEFTSRLRWGKGTLALWDNRCAQHNPVNDYHGFKRIMHRIALGRCRSSHLSGFYKPDSESAL